MMVRKTKVDLTAADVAGIARSIEVTCDAVDALQVAVQRNTVDSVAIKTQLENILGELRGLSATVRGDQGLVTKVALLAQQVEEVRRTVATGEEATRRNLETKLRELRYDLDALRTRHEGEIADLKRKHDKVHVRELEDVKKQLDEQKRSNSSALKTRIAAWSAGVATLAFIASVVFNILKSCGGIE